jgi:hypothetical protein
VSLTISDFQSIEDFPVVPDELIVDAIALKYQEASNIHLDSVYISNTTINGVALKVLITGQGRIPKTVPISLYKKEKLIAKTAVDFSPNINREETKEVVFKINNTKEPCIIDKHKLIIMKILKGK